MVAPQFSRTQSAIVVMRLALIILLLQALLWLGDRPGQVAAQQPVGQIVSVSAASYERTVAPDSLVAAFGINLATVTQAANTIPLPIILSNLTVEVNGRSAALLFISPGQINYLLPEHLTEGTGQVLVKRTSGEIIAAGEIEIRAGAPAIFMANTDVVGPPAANLIRVRADNSQVLESAAQFDGMRGRFVSRLIDLDAPSELVFLILYLTGTSREPQAGDYRVLLGGSECRPEFMSYIGVAPGFAGLKQANLNLSGCVRELREENPLSTFTGKVSVALADIKNAQTSNVFELEFASPVGAPPRITGLNKATLLAGEVLEIQGSGLAEVSEVYVTDSSGNRFNAQIERPVTQTTVRVRVPFGAGTGTLTAVTGRGESTFPLQMRTSVSGVVQFVQRQPDGSDRRIGLRNATLRVVLPNESAAVMSGDDGSFLIPDVEVPSAAQGTPIYLSVDGSTAGINNLSLKRLDRMVAFAGRDNLFPGYLEIRQSTGPSIPIGSGGLLPDEPVRMRASARPEESEQTGQTGEIVFEPNGSTVRFPDGSMVSAVTVTALDTGRVPVDLPAGQFSSLIVQLTPFGGEITPGGKLILPNVDALPAGTVGTLYRYDQTAGSMTLGQWVSAGQATVSEDGARVGTGQNAIRETTYYFVSVPRPLTTIYGSVNEADGQPARAALVQVRGQSGFALTDANGGFLLRNVPVVGAEMVIEVSYLRADGTVDRAERRGVVPRVGTTAVSPPILLPGQREGRAPVILLPRSLVMEAGKTIDHTFLAYARVATATLQPLLVTGAPFASITSLGNDRYVLRLTPGAGDAGNYTLAIVATDSDQRRTEEMIALEVKAPAVNLPVAESQMLATDEDRAVEITLAGSGGTQFRIVNAPRRGRLDGTAPNLIYTPNRDYNGTDNFSFVVGNGSVESLPGVVTIAVRPASDAPRLEVGSVFSTNIGQLLRAVINGFDPDAGQMLTLTSENLPQGAKIERVTGTSWVLEWRPTIDQIGSYAVSLMLRDDGTPPLTDSRTVMIDVEARWAQTSGPEGGSIRGLAVLGNSIFAGTHGGVFRSVDQGNSWVGVNNGLDNQFVDALVVSGGVLFAGTAAGVYRTVDQGNNWTEVNNGLGSQNVQTLAEEGGRIFAGTGGGVFRTTDQGENWTQVNNGLGSQDVRALVAIGGAIFAGTFNSGVFRTTDQGNNWTRVNNGLGNRDVRALVATGGAIFAGTFDNGVFRTTNQGDSWTQVNQGLGNQTVFALAVSGGTIFAGTFSAGVYRTTDQGNNWTQVSDGLGFQDVRALVPLGGIVFAGTFGNGVYRTTDQGSNWTQVNHGLRNQTVLELAVSGGTIFAGTFNSGVYRTTDQGNSWTQLTNGIGSPDVLALTVSDGTVFAGTSSSGVYRTTDEGESWTQVNNGLGFQIIRALAASGGAVFAGTTGNGVYRTTDQGNNWTQVNSGLGNRDIRVFAVSGGTLFAGTSGHGVYRTTDQGNSWTQVINGLGEQTVFALAVSGETIFAGTAGNGVYRTANQGGSWTQINSGLGNQNIDALAVSGGALFAGTVGDGVYLLSESAQVWIESNTGLTNKLINTTILDGESLLLGTFGGGAFRSTDSGINWSPSNSGLPAAADVRAFTRNSSGAFAGLLGQGIFYSADQGQTWAARSNGLGNLQVNALTSDAARLWAGTDGGVFRSTDNGLNWTAANNGLTRLRVLSLSFSNAGLFAGTEDGLFRSTNGGDSWAPVNQGLANLYIVSLGVAPDGGVLLAGTSNGLHRSTDQGQSWMKVTSGISDRILAMCFTTAGTRILAGTVYGFYLSEDNGASWRGINSGLLNLQVSGIAVVGNRVIAGTRSAGIFISQLE